METNLRYTSGTLHLIYDLFQLRLIQNLESTRWRDLENELLVPLA